MATAIKAPLSALYIDNLRFETPTEDTAVINTTPEFGETGVKVTAPISFTIVSFLAAALTNTKVWVSYSGNKYLAYDQAGTGIQAAFNGPLASATLQASLGSGVNDELILVLDPTTDLPSLSTIAVDIYTEASSDVLETYISFTTEDAAPPRPIEVLWRTPRQVRVRFNKAVDQSDDHTSAQWMVDLSGGMQFVAPSTILAKPALVNGKLVGRLIGCTGSAWPRNNGYHTITAVNSDTGAVTIDGSYIRSDTGVDADKDGNVVRRRRLRATVTPYWLEPRPQDEEETVCAYDPMVTNIRAPETEELPVDADPNEYVIVNFHDDVSLWRMYRLWSTGLEDWLGRPASGLEDDALAFTTPGFGSPAGRVTFWDLVSPEDRQDDLEANSQLRKMCVVLQDSSNVIWNRADSLAYLRDPDYCPVGWLDAFLHTQSNPFTFPLTENQKRRLLFVLTTILKRAGLAHNIEDAVAFFLGIDISVRPLIEGDWWVLGEDILGLGTILGPDTTFAKNSYEIISPITLTEEQRRIIREIAEILDPADMHLLGIVEPGDNPATLLFWELGVSSLGETTRLAI